MYAVEEACPLLLNAALFTVMTLEFRVPVIITGTLLTSRQ